MPNWRTAKSHLALRQYQSRCTAISAPRPAPERLRPHPAAAAPPPTALLPPPAHRTAVRGLALRSAADQTQRGLCTSSRMLTQVMCSIYSEPELAHARSPVVGGTSCNAVCPSFFTACTEIQCKIRCTNEIASTCRASMIAFCGHNCKSRQWHSAAIAHKFADDSIIFTCGV